MFNYLKQLGFGLTIDAAGVSCIRVRPRAGRLKLTGFYSLPLPAGVIRAGQINDEGAVSDLIKKTAALSRPRRIRDLFVHIALPEQSSFLQIIQLPKMPEAEIRDAIKWEVEANIPLPIDAVYYDWQILPPPKTRKPVDHLDIMVTAAPKEIVDSYIRVTKRAGFFPKSIETEPVALSRALVHKIFTPEPVLILEFSAGKVAVVIFSGSVPRFSSSIPVSGRFLEELEAFGEPAEKRPIKVKVMAVDEIKGPAADARAADVHEDKPPASADFFIEQIRSFIEFYEDHTEHEHREEAVKINKVLLCGSGLSPKMEEIFSRHIGIKTEFGNPLVNATKKPQRDFSALAPANSPALAGTLGLAIKDFI